MVLIARNRDSLSTPLPVSTSQRNRSIATSCPATYENIRIGKAWRSQSMSSLGSTSNYYSEYTASIESDKSYFWKLSACVILIFIPWIPNIGHINTLKAQRYQLELAIAAQHDFATELHDLSDDINGAKEKLHAITNRNEKAYRRLKKLHGELDLDSEKYLKAEKTEEVLVNRIERIEKTIQANDRKQIQRKYGNDQVKVEIELQYGEEVPSIVTLELNSKTMPHASNHFLKMVESNLWEGLPLARGMYNQFVASPSAMDEHHHSGISKFATANLTHLAFQEYEKPILQKYTVAFAGSRPAGPVFVIRMSESRGEDENHEATFATIVKGHDVLDSLMHLSLETGSIKMKSLRVIQ
eukprot:scaffold2659_cov107-Cylindrotheca_fusiformis.AAC.9